MWRLALLGLLGLAAACRGPAPAKAPEPRAFDHFQRAIHKGDYLAAYELLPLTFRRVYSKADFVRMMAGEAVVPARLQPPPDPFPKATPREAIRSLVVAWEGERWDVILDLVPARYREHVTVDTLRAQLQDPEQRMMLHRLAESLNAPIAEHGDHARMAYGAGYEVQLVREPDGWKIEDLD